MGDISVLKSNMPSVGLSLRGRSTFADTFADTLYNLSVSLYAPCQHYRF